MKRLIVCCDGTWNTPSQEDNGQIAPTNVYKIFRAIQDKDNHGIVQKKYYHTGVGTEGNKVSKILNGAFAGDLGNHIQSAYYWLGNNFEPDDEIYCFGFSRGAFTVRSLAGMMNKVGLLDLSKITGSPDEEYKKKWDLIEKAYTAYREGEIAQDQFIANYSNKLFDSQCEVKIKFLGVWDTVGAAGIPDEAELLNFFFDDKSQWKFHDNNLGKNVETGRHAMALDEIRSSFTVCRWLNRTGSSTDCHPDAKEVWFSGVHSDVGGGYAETQLSDIALDWMIKEALAKGIGIRNIKDQLKMDSSGEIHNSYKGVFAALKSRPRNIPFIDASSGECLHGSVLERMKADLILYPPYWQNKHLKKDETISIDVFAKDRWNYCEVYMFKDEEYKFSAEGEWVDNKSVCGWTGTQHDGHLDFGDVVRSVGSLWGKVEGLFKKKNKVVDFWGTKRFEKADWFICVGAIANDRGVSVAVSNDGTPVPHTYIDLPKHHASSYKVKHSGQFFAFANDAWNFYGNNKGSVRLTITRVK